MAWRFRIPIAPRESGVETATPLVDDGVVYVEDMESDVFALRATNGGLIWEHRFGDGTPGPNGLALGPGHSLVGSTDTTIFALDARTGALRWSHRILGSHESFVDIAPLVADGLVFTGTTGYGPGTRGAIEALDVRSGALRWRFDTIRGPWPHRALAGGGGIWETPTLSHGVLYAGIANPLPWGGSESLPNGGAYAGRALYTDSLVALDAHTGKLEWFDQVTPHDTRDHDLQNPPVVSHGLVIGSGKAGLVTAWDVATHRRRWQASVGVHRNDSGPLPRQAVEVCPGLLGGVETPVAVAGGRVFVPVVDLCYRESSVGAAATSFAQTDPAEGRGEVVALDARTGRRAWTRTIGSPPFGCATAAGDTVVVPTFDGHVLALAASDGATLWQARASAGINACPAVAGDSLYVAAGTPERSIAHPRYEVIAYRLPG